MTAETQSSERREQAPAGVPWRRTVLRILILTAAFVALTAFSAVLAGLTLTPSPASAGIAGANLTPGRSLRQYAEDYSFLAACKQAGGNVLMGTPFGLILPVLVPRRMRMVRVVLLTALVMAMVELAQGAMVEGRAFDVDDVILNTSGALIAYVLLGRIIGRRFHALAERGPGAEPGRAAPEPKAKAQPVSRAQPKRTSKAKAKPQSKPQSKPKAKPKSLTKPTPKAKAAGRFARLGGEYRPAWLRR
ncbi:VanZ family protein [Streptomyces sp. NPDC088116]|uniref:VanZ family protein n=1 Tax=Streptomyces sp. NPDC088116 TaxID=3365825 RepID=UPI0038214BDF